MRRKIFALASQASRYLALSVALSCSSLASRAGAASQVADASPPSGLGNEPGILDTYPDLKKFVFAEHESHLFFGFGLSPLTIINGKVGFGASLFQLHWINGPFDIEAFNASFGTAFGSTYGNEQYFLLRAAPKLRISHNISIGPMGGVEFVHFPSVTEELNKNQLFSQPFEFSTVGGVYGAEVSETFPIGALGKDNLIKINELIYRETYSATGTNNGWMYYYQQSALNSDQSPIAPNTVFLLEISFLY